MRLPQVLIFATVSYFHREWRDQPTQIRASNALVPATQFQLPTVTLCANLGGSEGLPRDQSLDFQK